MKLRIEIAEELPDEVVIRGKAITDEIRQLQAAFSRVLVGHTQLVMRIGETEYFVSESDILFFETQGERVCAHTAEKMYDTDKKLYELERLLPRSFLRVSKSCILNSAKVSSISKSISGNGEALFYDTYKKVYVSRMYYKQLKDYIYETRVSK